MSEIVYLLLGSNVGDRENYLDRARVLLAELEGFELTAASSIYLSEAEGMAPGTPSFMNQVIKGEYHYTAHELLRACENIETMLGRSGKGQLLPRTIDVDILLFGTEIITSDVLQVPHPKMTSRAFVLVPLIEIDPQLADPVSHKLLSDYLKPKDRKSVVLYRDHVARNR